MARPKQANHQLTSPPPQVRQIADMVADIVFKEVSKLVAITGQLAADNAELRDRVATLEEIVLGDEDDDVLPDPTCSCAGCVALRAAQSASTMPN